MTVAVRIAIEYLLGLSKLPTAELETIADRILPDANDWSSFLIFKFYLRHLKDVTVDQAKVFSSQAWTKFQGLHLLLSSNPQQFSNYNTESLTPGQSLWLEVLTQVALQPARLVESTETARSFLQLQLKDLFSAQALADSPDPASFTARKEELLRFISDDAEPVANVFIRYPVEPVLHDFVKYINSAWDEIHPTFIEGVVEELLQGAYQPAFRLFPVTANNQQDDASQGEEHIEEHEEKPQIPIAPPVPQQPLDPADPPVHSPNPAHPPASPAPPLRGGFGKAKPRTAAASLDSAAEYESPPTASKATSRKAAAPPEDATKYESPPKRAKATPKPQPVPIHSPASMAEDSVPHTAAAAGPSTSAAAAGPSSGIAAEAIPGTSAAAAQEPLEADRWDSLKQAVARATFMAGTRQAPAEARPQPAAEVQGKGAREQEDAPAQGQPQQEEPQQQEQENEHEAGDPAVTEQQEEEQEQPQPPPRARLSELSGEELVRRSRAVDEANRRGPAMRHQQVETRRKWAPFEERVLMALVKQHGEGKWKAILEAGQAAGYFRERTNVNLKDKYRNLVHSGRLSVNN